MAQLPVLVGEVIEFDDHAGLGTVQAADGSVHAFHCTAIADGSRSIAVGTAVQYRVQAGRRGQWEAVQLVPV